MQLSGKQIREIEEALLDAFPSRDELSRVVRIELDERLEAIADGANQRVVIFNLVNWAERTGKIDALLQGASRQNPGNPTLQKLMQTWRTTPPPEDAARPPAPPGDRPTTGNTPTDARGSQGAIFNASGPITQNFIGYSTDQRKMLDRPASIEPTESGTQPPPRKPYLPLLLITVVAVLVLALGAYGLGRMLDPTVTPTPSSVSANPVTPPPQEVSAPQLIDSPTLTATGTPTVELAATPTESSTSVPAVVAQQLPSPTDTPRPTPTATTTSGTTGSNLMATAEAAGNFTILVKALKATGLDKTLAGAGPFTVFAPTDAAFEALGSATVDALLKDTKQLAQILQFHVVQNSSIASSSITNGLEATTVLGSPVEFTVAGKNVKVQDSNVIVPDVAASNGVIHAIDKVMLPPAP
jgi:uncharacterized surface protein with fasciclin (FAS1) repeats